MPDLNWHIYISGPMAQFEDRNHPLFNQCAANLRALGWNVVNPAENYGGSIDLPRHKYLALDVFQLIMHCRSICLLEGWAESDGAKLEAQIALDRGYSFYSWGPYGGLQILQRHDIWGILDGK